MPDSLDAYLDPAPRARRSNYDDIITRHAQRAGLDPELVRAVVVQESGGNPRAVSPKGAQGIGQLMPATAKRFGVTDPFDPEQNIRGATDYLKFLNDKFAGNRDLVLAGYNAGEGAVEKFGNRIPPYKETQNYVRSINARLGQGQSSQKPTQKPTTDLDAYLDPTPSQAPQSGPTIEEALQSLTRSTNKATEKLKRQAARQPPPPPIPRLTDDLMPAPTRSLTFAEDRAQRVAAKEAAKRTGMGGLHRLDDPEVARIARAQQQESERNPALSKLRDGLTTSQAREAAQRASVERATELQRQQEEPEIQRLTEAYRVDIRKQGLPQWLTEALSRGGAGIGEFGVGLGKLLAPFTRDPTTANQRLDTLRKHAEAMTRAAVAEGADRNVVSRTIQDATSGFIASTPELAAMMVGAPPIGTFGAGSGIRAIGRGENTEGVMKSVGQGLATGGAFEAPVPSRITSTLGRAVTKGAIVGTATGAMDAAAGATPRQAISSGLTNAIFAGLGEHGRAQAQTQNVSREPLAPKPDVPTPSGEPSTSQSAPSNVVEAARQRYQQVAGEMFRLDQRLMDIYRENLPPETRSDLYRQREGLFKQVLDTQKEIQALGYDITPIGELKPITREQQEAVEPPPVMPEHHSAYQPRRVRGEGKGQFKKGKPRIPEQVEATSAETIRSNQEVLQEPTPGGEQQGSEVARGADLRREQQQPVDQIAKSEVLTRRPAESEKTEAQVASTPAISQALKDWMSNRAYVDNAGNYRVKREGGSNGPIAPWNKEVKRAFKNVSEFAKAARSLKESEARQEDVGNTEAAVNPPLSRAPLQVRAEPAPQAPPSIPPKPLERSFPKSAEAVGLPGGENTKYDPITNEESLAKADKRIKQVGIDRAASEIAMRKEASPEDVATGIRLMQTFTQAGQHERAADIAGDLAEKLTKAGQSVQAASIISRLSPEGVLLTAQRKLPEGKKLTKGQSASLVSQAKTVQEADARIADLEKQIAEMQANVSQKKASKPRLTEKIGTLEIRLGKLESDARARLEARKQQAQAEAQKLTEKGERGAVANPASVALDLGDLAIVGAAKIARKGMSTAKWTAEMVSEFGEEIKPHLKKLYRDSYGIYDQNRKAMASEAQERSIKREHPTARPDDLDALIQQRAQARKDARTARAEMARLFNDLTATPLSRAKAVAMDVANVPRTLKSSLDLSAPRQGAMWMINHPIEGAKTFFGKQIKAMRETNYDRYVDQLESDPDYPLMTRSGLALTTADARVNALTAREEAFMSRLAGKIPGIKHSERAYTTFLDTARSSWFKQLKNVAEMKAEKEGKLVTKEQYEAIANFVNIATGRGNLGKGMLNNISPALNALFFAPKFAASKVQIFDPWVYARLPAGARRQAMREAATYYGAMASTALLLKFGLGLSVGLNPRGTKDEKDSDFMKLRVGNTRYDLANGSGQYVVLAARLIKNVENKHAGKKDPYGYSIRDNVDRFLRYKYSPPAALVRNVWEGKNAIGEKTNLKREAIESIIPLFEKDLYDAYKEEGLTGVAKTAPGFVGVGVNTYKDKKKGK